MTDQQEELDKILEAYKAAVIHEYRFPDDVGTRLSELVTQSLNRYIDKALIRGLEKMQEHVVDELDKGAVDDFTARRYIKNYIADLKNTGEGDE